MEETGRVGTTNGRELMRMGRVSETWTGRGGIRRGGRGHGEDDEGPNRCYGVDDEGVIDEGGEGVGAGDEGEGAGDQDGGSEGDVFALLPVGALFESLGAGSREPEEHALEGVSHGCELGLPVGSPFSFRHMPRRGYCGPR